MGNNGSNFISINGKKYDIPKNFALQVGMKIEDCKEKDKPLFNKVDGINGKNNGKIEESELEAYFQQKINEMEQNAQGNKETVSSPKQQTKTDADFTARLSTKAVRNTFYELAKEFYRAEGDVKNPTEYQLHARAKQIQEANPKLVDGQLLGKNIYIPTTTKYMEFMNKTSYQREKKNSEAIAHTFRNIADKNSGKTSVKEMQKCVDTYFTPQNIEAILDSYSKYGKGDSSIVATVLNQSGAAFGKEGLKAQKDVLTDIMKNLVGAAQNAGVPNKKINKYINEFNDCIKSINGATWSPNPEKFEKVLDGLRSEILVKRENVTNVSRSQAQSETVNVAKKEHKQAANLFNQAREAEKEGALWSSKVGDFFLWRYGAKTNDDVKEILGDRSALLDELSKIDDPKEFREVFKNGFVKNGIKVPGFNLDFDEEKMAARKEMVDRYTYAKNIDVTYQTCMTCSLASDDNIREVIKKEFAFDDETINTIILEHASIKGMIPQTPKEKAECLRRYLNELSSSAYAELKAATNGKSISEMENDIEVITRSTFGDDIVDTVNKHNKNESFAAMGAEISGQAIGTLAMQFIPVAGTAAAAKFERTVAKLGPKAVKLRNLAAKTTKAANIVEKSVAGAKLTSSGKMVTSAVELGAATFAVKTTNGEDGKEALLDAIKMMPYGAVGAAASDLAPIITKLFGVESGLAERIAVAALNTAGTAGVMAAEGSEITWQDLLANTVLSMIAGGSGKASAGKTKVQTKVKTEVPTKVKTNAQTPKTTPAGEKPQITETSTKPSNKTQNWKSKLFGNKSPEKVVKGTETITMDGKNYEFTVYEDGSIDFSHAKLNGKNVKLEMESDIMANTAGGVPEGVQNTFSRKSIEKMSNSLAKKGLDQDLYMKAIDEITLRILNGDSPSLKLLDEISENILKNSNLDENTLKSLKKTMTKNLQTILGTTDEFTPITSYILKDIPNPETNIGLKRAVEKFKTGIEKVKAQKLNAPIEQPKPTNPFEPEKTKAEPPSQQANTEKSNTVPDKPAETSGNTNTNTTTSRYAKYDDYVKKYPELENDLFGHPENNMSMGEIMDDYEQFLKQMGTDHFDESDIWARVSSKIVGDSDQTTAFNTIKKHFHNDIVEKELRLKTLSQKYNIDEASVKDADNVIEQIRAKANNDEPISLYELNDMMDGAYLRDRAKLIVFEDNSINSYLNKNVNTHVLKNESNYRNLIPDAKEFNDFQNACNRISQYINNNPIDNPKQLSDLLNNYKYQDGYTQDVINGIQDVLQNDPSITSKFNKSFIDEVLESFF